MERQLSLYVCSVHIELTSEYRHSTKGLTPNWSINAWLKSASCTNKKIHDHCVVEIAYVRQVKLRCKVESTVWHHLSICKLVGLGQCNILSRTWYVAECDGVMPCFSITGPKFISFSKRSSTVEKNPYSVPKELMPVAHVPCFVHSWALQNTRTCNVQELPSDMEY